MVHIILSMVHLYRHQVLPIHSSMVGCRHLFPRYLHGVVYLIFVILCTFGVLGYLKYGAELNDDCGKGQIIILVIAQHHTSRAVYIGVAATLIISVLFTYP